MSLPNGSQIGPYEIVGWLGAGGMGDVYRARDSRLSRDVAIKLIPESFATDTDRLSRFEQEARAVGRLNHPNILAIHDIGTHSGAPYIVSELLEGETLRSRLAGGALPVRKVVEYARQIAEGLAAAHDKGIVHRDVKPENLFITKEERVKILDFGIAKLTAPADDRAAHTGERTETAAGMVVGTAGYMSPEQVRGESVDARSDLFNFGTVLYEMLTGRPSFKRATAAETMTAILKEDPPEPLPTNIPPTLARIISRCLEKAREARFQSARDLAFALEFLTDSVPAAPVVAAVPTARRARWSPETVAWAIAALAVVAAATVWTRSQRSEERDALSHVLSVTPPDGVSLATEEAPAISPDGRQLAFVGYDAGGKQLLFTRALNTAAPALSRPNTEGASLPFWSPNSQAIGFFAEGKLKTLDIATGRIQTLTDAVGPRGGTWNQNDEIVYVPRPLEGPHRIAATGGQPTQVATDAGPGPKGWFPSFLPDGRRFLIFVSAPLPENSGVFVASLDSPSRNRLLSARSHAIYVQPGYLVYWREATLVAQPFDSKTLELRGKPMTVATAVGLNPVTNQALFSASSSGTLVFFAGAVAQSELVWVDRAGEEMVRPGISATLTTMSLSPDATSVVYDDADLRTAMMDLWQLDFARGVPSRLTFHPSHDLFPLWSPSATRIAFTSLREGVPSIYELDAKGGGNDKLVFKSTLPSTPSGWSSDGQLLLYTVVDPKTSGDIWALPSDGKQPYAVVNTAADERYGTLSPDGRWLAYVSNETGPYEVYVRAFGRTGLLRQVTTRGGLQPQWRSDGGELFYLAPDNKLMAVDFRSGPGTFEAGPPKALFPTRTKWIEIQGTSRTYAAAPDGQRFLLANAIEPRSAPITIILNWTAELR